jgi:hypothetical protein
MLTPETDEEMVVAVAVGTAEVIMVAMAATGEVIQPPEQQCRFSKGMQLQAQMEDCSPVRLGSNARVEATTLIFVQKPLAAKPLSFSKAKLLRSLQLLKATMAALKLTSLKSVRHLPRSSFKKLLRCRESLKVHSL